MQSFQVPQYIEEESRLVGSLTFNQVIILVLGGGLAYLAYSLLSQWVSLIALVFISTTTLILAFVQIEGMPSYRLIMPLIRHLWLPHMYIWKRPETGSGLTREPIETKKNTAPEIIKEPQKKVNIQDLSSILNKDKKS